MAATSVFDYVIIGGGSAGLVVAARLTELQDISVCVLEAGGDITHTPDASVPGYGKNLWFNKETDWGFLSVPQKHSEGAVLPMFRGKALGDQAWQTGLMQLNRATAREYDALEGVGNVGWNSAEIHKYMVKSQSLAYTPEELAEHRFEADKKDFGSGPILNTPSPYKLTYRDEWYKALEECGVPYNANAIGGETMGSWMSPIAIGGETMGSWMSPIAVHPKTGLFCECILRTQQASKNLTVITGAHVTRIQLNTTSGKPVAEGVYYETNGKKHVVSARKEVILSAGSIQTPQILELSGIGQKKILDKYGIPTIVELPGVGENYRWLLYQLYRHVSYFTSLAQDHLVVAMSYEMKPGHESHHPLATSPEETISTITNICAFVPLPKLEDHQALLDLARKSNFSKIPPSVLNIQQEWLKDETMPQIELVTIPHFLPTAYQPEPDPEKRYLCVCGLLLHPFARGSIHINSSDAFKHPDIDLSAFDNEIDWQTFVQGAKLTRKVHLKTRAFNGVVAKEIAPGSDGDTQEGLEKYLKAQLVSGYHPVGTAAMMQKEEGGVVDNKLKVYGVDRLRVVDASILPFQLGTDPQTTVYAIAEKAADLIKEDI